MKTLLANTPWWAVSAGIHLVLLLGATLVYVERLLATDGVDFQVHPRAPEACQGFDYPRDTIERRAFLPPDSDRGTLTEELLVFDQESTPSRPEERGGDGERLERPEARLSFVETGPRIRRVDRSETTNILRCGMGEGYSQRYESGSTRLVMSNVSTCCRSAETESAVTAALRWLARHQNADGSWSAGSVCRTCTGSGDPDHDTGVTALATLAFLGAGYTHFSKDSFTDPAFPNLRLYFGETLKKAEQWLLARQDAEGGVGERGPKHLYNHAIAALALSEGYGMTSADALRLPAQKAIDFLVAAQNPGKGWRYTSRAGDNDTSVTGWAVMALKSAELSTLAFPRSAYDGAINWLDEATEKAGHYRAGYTAAGTGKVYMPGRNEQFADHPTMSAVSVLSRIFVQRAKRAPEISAVMLLQDDLPEWENGKVDFYYWYYASLALFQYDGPTGGLWSRWNPAMKQALVPNQKLASDGCQNGSWDPAEDRWGFEGGRVYATALNCMTLEVYYRYANVFGTQH